MKAISFSIVVVLASLSMLAMQVHAHGFMSNPKPRNVISRTDHYCPHCFNGGGTGNVAANSNGVWPEVETVETSKRHGLCGDPAGQDDHMVGGKSYNGNIVGTYTSGGTIDIDVGVTAHHNGHFEFYLCNKADLANPNGPITQECLNKYPLKRTKGFPSTNPIDPNYPERYYLDPKCSLPTEYFNDASISGWKVPTMRFDLPDIECEHCVLQFYWVTANSCLPPGYREYSWPTTHSECSGDGGSSGWWAPHLGACANSYPEEFWNCADIKIVRDGKTSAPVSSPTQPPKTEEPTKEPTEKGSPPTKRPTQMVTSNPEPEDEKRVVAYIPNWKACPTKAQLEHYTHALIAFAVTYPRWLPAGQDTCGTDKTCTVQPMPGCGGKTMKQMVDYLHESDVKVILSFGGASMGGVWETKGAAGSNSCWEHCIGKEDSLIEQLAELVKSTGADGIDVDYEYFLDEPKYVNFLSTFSKGLRKALPRPMLLTHAPMDPDLCTSNIHSGCRKEYMEVLKSHSSDIDFIMVQYYNGYQNPVTRWPGTLSHFNALASEAFQGDASKVVMGFCIGDCPGFNVQSGETATGVMRQLTDAVPNHGGLMFWESSADSDGSWSKPVADYFSGEVEPAKPTSPPTKNDGKSFVERHGKLSLDGVQLVGANGEPVHLKGMSSHGIHWFPNCYTKDSIKHLRDEWNINLFRIAMYIGENGYDSQRGLKQNVKDMVDWCEELGIYVMIDWHVLTPGNPNAWLDGEGASTGLAIDWWKEMATLYKNKDHVLYEIANEPNNVQWTSVKKYHDSVIKAIRSIDKETIIIAGTTTWSQDVHLAVQNPVADPYNVMYAFHFYAGTHESLLQRVRDAASKIPIFSTEWGTSQASGDGGPYLDIATKFLDMFEELSISWAQWSFADKSEVSAALKPGACGRKAWSDTSVSGTFVKKYLLKGKEDSIGQGCTGEPCLIDGQCRSEWGWCNEGPSYCNEKSLWRPEGCNGGSTDPVTNAPTKKVTSAPTEGKGDVPTAKKTPKPTLKPTKSNDNTGGSGGCSLTPYEFEVANDWKSGYQARVTVTNELGKDITDWKLHIKLPKGHTFSSGWEGTFEDLGNGVLEITSAGSWQNKISAGSVISPGYTASGPGERGIGQVKFVANGVTYDCEKGDDGEEPTDAPTGVPTKKPTKKKKTKKPTKSPSKAVGTPKPTLRKTNSPVTSAPTVDTSDTIQKIIDLLTLLIATGNAETAEVAQEVLNKLKSLDLSSPQPLSSELVAELTTSMLKAFPARGVPGGGRNNNVVANIETTNTLLESLSSLPTASTGKDTDAPTTSSKDDNNNDDDDDKEKEGDKTLIFAIAGGAGFAVVAVVGVLAYSFRRKSKDHNQIPGSEEPHTDIEMNSHNRAKSEYGV